MCSQCVYRLLCLLVCLDMCICMCGGTFLHVAAYVIIVPCIQIEGLDQLSWACVAIAADELASQAKAALCVPLAAD